MRPDLEDKVLRTLGRPPHLRAVASEVLVGLPTRGSAVASIYQLAYTMGCLYIVAGPAILAAPDAVLDALSEKNGGAAQVFKTLLLVLVGLGLLEWRRPGSLRGLAVQIRRRVSRQDPNYGMPPSPPAPQRDEDDWRDQTPPQ